MKIEANFMFIGIAFVIAFLRSQCGCHPDAYWKSIFTMLQYAIIIYGLVECFWPQIRKTIVRLLRNPEEEDNRWISSFDHTNIPIVSFDTIQEAIRKNREANEPKEEEPINEEPAKEEQAISAGQAKEEPTVEQIEVL